MRKCCLTPPLPILRSSKHLRTNCIVCNKKQNKFELVFSGHLLYMLTATVLLNHCCLQTHLLYASVHHFMHVGVCCCCYHCCGLSGLNLHLDNGNGNSHTCHALRWIASRGDSQTLHAIILTDSMSLLQKVKSEMRSPDWHVSVFIIHLRRILWVYCPEHAVVKGNDRADRLVGKATITGGLRLGRSEMLRNLRHFLWAQSQVHHTIGRLKERGVERGNAQRSSLRGRERAIVNQNNIGTVSRATLRKLLRDRVECIMGFPECIVLDTILN